ncbi:MAG TPA: hypothetical protein VGO34_12010 [Alphaproteobacteria bacterium]|jgi:hypothetical protein
MNLRAFLGLALATLIAVVAVVILLVTGNSGPAARAPGTTLLPTLAKSTDSAAKIVWTHAGETTDIVKDGDTWTVAELAGYPAFPAQVNEAILGPSRFQTFEPKTQRPELYDKLDLNDPTSADAKSSRLQILDGAGKTLADVIVGRVKNATAGQESLYARLPSEPRAWLVRGKVDLPTARLGWVDAQVLTIDLPRIRDAWLNKPAKGGRVHVFKTKADDRDYAIDGMPANYETKDVFGSEDVARVIQQLSFEDVRPAAKQPVATTGQPYAEFATFDGLKVDLWLADADGKTWAAIKASPQAGNADEAIAKEAAAINARNAAWVYSLPSYELGNLRKTLDDLIQPKPKS